ncbi:hypothetical protein [Streptomyces sp. NPDC096153]|uniref:hypothetical protein n=1 Tax=Streptomyces sp. NPDC096153 TaxID=3155548 RepID=UPI003327FD13
MSTTPERACAHCSASLVGKRPNALYCDERCKDRARRKRDREAGKMTYVRKGRNHPRPSQQKYAPGFTAGALTLVTRDGDRAVFKCECGNYKSLGIRNVATGRTANCADRANHPDPRAKAEPGAYSTAHHKVAAERGPASLYECSRCDAPAEHWAYLHGTHDVKADATGREAGSPFSTNPEQYAPMCRACHTRWDRAKEETAGTGLSLAHVAHWTATH